MQFEQIYTIIAILFLLLLLTSILVFCIVHCCRKKKNKKVDVEELPENVLGSELNFEKDEKQRKTISRLFGRFVFDEMQNKYAKLKKKNNNLKKENENLKKEIKVKRNTSEFNEIEI